MSILLRLLDVFSQAKDQGWNGGVMVWEVCIALAYTFWEQSLTAPSHTVP
jgi:hypothetical protein